MRGRTTPSVIRALTAIAAVLCLVLVLAPGLAGPARAGNLLENPALDTGGADGEGATPGGWVLEGDAAVEPTDDGLALRSTGGTPFLFQQVPVDRRLKGSMATLSAWVRSEVTEGAYVEFSNRKGMDVRSKAHPGDGLWHRLELTVRVPAEDDVAEFRLRHYRGGTTYIREASLVPGSRSLMGRNPTAAVDGGPRAIWFVFIGLLALLVPFYFRRRRYMAHARLLEAGLTLLVISNLLLLVSRPEVSAVTSNIAWGLTASASLVFAVSVLGAGGASLFRRPGAVYVTVFLAVLAVLLYELSTGSVSGAEDAAKTLFALVVAEAVVMTARRVRRIFAAGEREACTVRLEDPAAGKDPGAVVDEDVHEGGAPVPGAAAGEGAVAAEERMNERVPMG